MIKPIVNLTKTRDVITPTKSTDGSYGYDLYIPKDIFKVVDQNTGTTIPLGIKSSFSNDFIILLFVKDEIALKGVQLKNSIGIITSKNTEEWVASIRNVGTSIEVNEDNSIFQFIMVPLVNPEVTIK